MENVVHNIANQINKGERLLISQNFLPLTSSYVGKDIIQNQEAIIHHFSDYFRITNSIWLQDYVSDGNDNWFIGLFVKKSN